MSANTLTFERLLETMQSFREKYPPSVFDKGADMSEATCKALIKLLRIEFPDGNPEWFKVYKMTLTGIDIHIVPDIPFGEVEPCRCKEREFTESIKADMERARDIKRFFPSGKVEYHPIDPYPPEPIQSTAEFTQEMSIEEVKKRYPDAEIPEGGKR